MFDVLEISSKWDRLASELTSKMPVSFEIAYPTYYDLRKTKSLNDACVLTFLKILSEVPDTLIDRKYGVEKAEEVSKLSKELLSHVDDEDFHIKLQEFDDYLFENKLNPGTTADLVVVGIFLSYLKLEFDKS